MNKKQVLTIVIGIVVIMMQSCSTPSSTPSVIISTDTITPLPPTLVPTETPVPTNTPVPTSTPIPLMWKQINTGQEFARDMVTAFATDKKDPNVIYAAMMSAGIYKTIDGGLSWYPAHQGLASAQVTSLLIDSKNPRILYAVTMGGIFKAEDGGEKWFRISDGTGLLMDYQNTSHLYAHDENGIYETTDQGDTWKTVYELKKGCPDEIHSWAIHPANGDMLFIGGGEMCGGVYQSSDSGRNWILIGLEDEPNISQLAIGLDKEGDFSVYAYFDSTPFAMQRMFRETGIYVSYDGGAHWSFTRGWCEILNSVLDDPSAVYCEMSIKRGKGAWRDLGTATSTLYTAVHIDHPNSTERIISDTIYVSTSYPYVGIFISTDGGASWAKRNVGIGSARSELKIDPKDSKRIYLAAYYITRDHGSCTLYSSQDSGKIWLPLRAADWCGPTFDAAHTLYMNERGALQMSFDGGKTWLWGNERNNFPGKPANDHYDRDKFEWGNHLLPLYFQGGSESVSANPYTERLVYDIGDTIYYSTGSEWQKSNGSEGLRDARLFYTDQSKMIYAIGKSHQSYSTDNGKTWQSCGEDVTASRSDSRLALDLQGSRLYLATTGQGVMISTDNCGSWQASNDGLSNLFVNTLAIDPKNSNTIYAGTDTGAYVSFDSGRSWNQINEGLLDATIIYSIAVDMNSNVYAATPFGIYQLAHK